LILDFEFDQHLESHKHVISIIMGFRDTGCYTSSLSRARSCPCSSTATTVEGDEALHQSTSRDWHHNKKQAQASAGTE
jgi:hypothetical protein